MLGARKLKNKGTGFSVTKKLAEQMKIAGCQITNLPLQKNWTEFKAHFEN